MNDERLARLEEKLAWLQRHVTAQDKAMLELAEQIGQLKRKLSELSQRPGAESAPSHARSDERPPHYWTVGSEGRKNGSPDGVLRG